MARKSIWTIPLCAMALCCIDVGALADTHYVSPEGGDVPPYTTPETAARRIGDAMEDAEWVIAFFHCPPYTDSVETTHDWVAADVENVRLWLPRVFRDPNYPDSKNPHQTVDLAFSGHNHFYERSLWDGVNYIVTGGGGAPFHNPFRSENRNTERRKAAREFHHCILEPLSATDMRLIVWGQDPVDPIEDVIVH